MPNSEVDKTTASKLTLIAKKAKEQPKLKFTSLAHLLSPTLVALCFSELKHKRAAGVDGRTVESYEPAEIKQAAQQTVIALKNHSYRPQPVRRLLIPKANGKLRPLGIPASIDKAVQFACAKILELLWEPLFLDLSYGFRPRRSAHQALAAVNHMVMGKKVNWIIDADIKGFFDNVNHDKMMQCLKERISDPNMLWLIRKFLKAPVMDGNIIVKTRVGTPQGGIISPILANIYLHYCLDLWFTVREMKQLTGYAELVRYADDFVVGCQYKHEAEKLLRDIRTRLLEFGLELAQDKTRILEFGRYAETNIGKRTGEKPQTFDFLGFSHYCSTTRDGRFALKIKTSKKKFAASAKALTEWMRQARNKYPLPVISAMLALKLKGHYNYYGLSGNFEAIKRFFVHTEKVVFKWTNRRSQKKSWNWEYFRAYLDKYPLPRPKLTYAIYNTW